MNPTTLPNLETVFQYDDPAGSEQRLAELAGSAEAQADPIYYCELLTRWARTKGLQRRFDEAHQTLDQAEAMNPTDANCRARIAIERGRVYNSSGDKAAAKPLFQQSFDIADEARLEGLAVDALHMLAIVEPGEVGLAWNERAIEYADRSTDPAAKKWMPSLLNNTAWSHHDAGRYGRALELFEKAHQLRAAEGTPHLERIARWSVARCLRSLGRYEEALTMQEALLAQQDGGGAGYTEEELGELHLALGKPERAKPFFATAYEKLSKDPWLQANEAGRLVRLQSLSK